MPNQEIPALLVAEREAVVFPLERLARRMRVPEHAITQRIMHVCLTVAAEMWLRAHPELNGNDAARIFGEMANEAIHAFCDGCVVARPSVHLVKERKAMRNGRAFPITFWLLLAALVVLGGYLCGCAEVESEGVDSSPVSRRGSANLDAGVDGGTDLISVDVRPPALDTQAFTDATPRVDLAAEAPGVASDFRPVPDTMPECPVVAWTAPPSGAPTDTRWTLHAAVPAGAMCFSFCAATVTYLQLAQLPWRKVEINGQAALATPNDVSGSWPGVAAVAGRYVVRISAGDAGELWLYGWPSNTTGACS